MISQSLMAHLILDEPFDPKIEWRNGSRDTSKIHNSVSGGSFSFVFLLHYDENILNNWFFPFSNRILKSLKRKKISYFLASCGLLYCDTLVSKKSKKEKKFYSIFQVNLEIVKRGKGRVEIKFLLRSFNAISQLFSLTPSPTFGKTPKIETP